MFVYLPVEHEGNVPCIGAYKTFGLRVLQCGAEGVRELMTLPDISTDFEFISGLASLFTELQLSPLHLPDILQDLL